MTTVDLKAENDFRKSVEQAMMLTENGLNTFLDLRTLLNKLKDMPKNASYEEAIQNLVEKERTAVEFLQKAIVIEKLLIEDQRKEIQELIDSL